MQPLYNLMEKSDCFEPFIVVSYFKDNYKKHSYKHIFNFYSKFADTKIGYDEKQQKTIDLRKFNPDVVFYQQPWGLFKNQNVGYVSDFALCCYSPYSVVPSPKATSVHLEKFYFKLFKYFVLHNKIKKQFENSVGYIGYNIEPIGHPKLDTYNGYKQENYVHKYVIYSPHFSFHKNSLLKYGTFDWSGEYILEFAKAHPELNWLFKPHPNFYKELSKIYGEEFADVYISNWKKIAKFYDDGNYFDIFKNSKCLITDCSSFLTEYFPTGQPVIHLRNKNSEKFNIINQIISETYYSAYSNEELSKFLNEILIKNNDYLKSKRERIYKDLKFNFNSGEKIFKYLYNAIYKNGRI